MCAPPDLTPDHMWFGTSVQLSLVSSSPRYSSERLSKSSWLRPSGHASGPLPCLVRRGVVTEVICV